MKRVKVTGDGYSRFRWRVTAPGASAFQVSAFRPSAIRWRLPAEQLSGWC